MVDSKENYKFDLGVEGFINWNSHNNFQSFSKLPLHEQLTKWSHEHEENVLTDVLGDNVQDWLSMTFILCITGIIKCPHR